MKRVKTQTINIDLHLWEEAKRLAKRNHQASISEVIAQLLEEWMASANKHITLKSSHLKKQEKVRRSLYCDIKLWKSVIVYAKEHFGKSGSFIIDALLRNWVSEEKKRRPENPNQAKLI